MWTTTTITTAVTFLLTVLKWFFDKKAKKKLSDKEFVDYILDHQKKRGRAGQSALDAEDALSEALAEMENEK